MSQRKSDILLAARLLFNEKGISAIATRDIANHLNISQGNLTYHFPQKSQLIEALYFEMIKKLESITSESGLQPPTLEMVITWTIAQGKIQEAYRFLWLDFARIKREHSTIEQHFTVMIDQQKTQFSMLTEVLKYQGILDVTLGGEEIDWLFEQVLVLGNFWPHAAEVFHPLQSRTTHYAFLTLSPLLPYLTPQGRKDWDQLQSKFG